MKHLLICVGRLKCNYAHVGVDDYLKRLRRYTDIDFVEIREEKSLYSSNVATALKKEAAKILHRVDSRDLVVSLHDRGEQQTSFDFAEFVSEALVIGKKRICYIVGGPYGLHPSVMSRSDKVLSLSLMTFPHELARLFLVEQLYRAFTIIRGEPYSH